MTDLGFRRSVPSVSLTEALSQFPNGLVLIEKEAKMQHHNVSANTSVVSDEVMFFARREAQRLRAARLAADQQPPLEEKAIAIRVQRPTTASPSHSPAKNKIKRAQSAGSRLGLKTFDVKGSPSKIETRAHLADSTEQLQHLRDEIDGLALQLREEVPSEIEDVDTAFDDESKRWFARELYSLKLECGLVRKTNNRSKQIMQIIKIHRTALRVIQVAASRPILRVLNPHIYSDLVGLIKELLNLSDNLKLPDWNPKEVLSALEDAILLPSRKGSKRALINPQDIAPLLVPKKTVARKPPAAAPYKKGDKGPSRFFDSDLPYRNRNFVPANSKKSRPNTAKAGTSRTKLTKKSNQAKPTKSAIHLSSKNDIQIPRQKSAVQSRSRSYPQKHGKLLREISLNDHSQSDLSNDEDPIRLCANEFHSNDPDISSIEDFYGDKSEVEGYYKETPIVEYIECPSQSELDDSKKNTKKLANATERTSLARKKRSEKRDSRSRVSRSPKIPPESASTKVTNYSRQKPYKSDADLMKKPPRPIPKSVVSEGIYPSESHENILSRYRSAENKSVSQISREELEDIIQRLQRMEEEEAQMRDRLEKINQDVDQKYSSFAKNQISLPARESKDRLATMDSEFMIPKPSVKDADRIVEEAINEARAKEQKTNQDNAAKTKEYTQTELVNEMTELLLNDVVDGVFEEVEDALDTYIDDVYEKELNVDIDENNTISILSHEHSIQQSFHTTISVDQSDT